ncbi:putative Alpha-L-fucosidase 2 precursor [Hibiscus syriacus]|uniref:Alpha-L-fucosidase 2 n=1 Tax=Hibiscus syriacus TaxID=106335 RepID=A0A6A2Y7X7_HIBSY|nr:putative Alpha-L-fucosidase 2 precursor [Hibiscus syriacus]
MVYYQFSRSSYQDYLKILEADVQYANSMAAAIPRAKSGAHLQMKLVYNQLAPLFLFLLQWMDSSCICLLPRYQDLFHVLVYKLHGCLGELDDYKGRRSTIDSYGQKRLGHVDREREDECGICLEPCTKMVLPNCCHAMCIKCYRNWNMKSESCPFCRGSLKRVNSEDLWVLTCNDDVVDNETFSKEDLLRFYLYINSLPKDCSDAHFLVYYEYLI